MAILVLGPKSGFIYNVFESGELRAYEGELFDGVWPELSAAGWVDVTDQNKTHPVHFNDRYAKYQKVFLRKVSM